MKKLIKSIIIIEVAAIFFIIAFIIIDNNSFKTDEIEIKELSTIIREPYQKYAKTNKETYIYNTEKQKIGKIENDVELSLKEKIIDNDMEFFSIDNFDNKYYIKYEDVYLIDKLSEKDNRYKNYIPFNENIITSEETNFYDENNNLIYSFDKSFDIPIIIKDDERYGIELNDKLLYVFKENVVKTKQNHNTDKTNANGVGVLNYHAFYDENVPEEKFNCNTEICHSKKQFKAHLDYFKENKIMTLKMKELEMYIDGKIQLPKSVLITIDDGDKTKIAIDMLTEYKMYATIFLITSWYNPNEYYKTDYIELHSHSDNLHKTGDCPMGQGGGIQCLSEETIKEDLRKSREKLNDTTYFCYPFYEYNDYSIRMLKEAGFNMAFIGESKDSDNLVHVGDDKFKLRRFVIVTYTTLEDFDNYFGQIK